MRVVLLDARAARHLRGDIYEVRVRTREGMAVAPDGSVWVAQPWANKITRLSCRG